MMVAYASQARLKRVVLDGRTSWDVLLRGTVICRLTRSASLGRAFTKSQMGTRHVSAWRGSVEHVADLSEAERRAVQRQLDSRDKTTRDAAVRHVFRSYEQAGVALPLESREAA